jgi:hypothetical protein
MMPVTLHANISARSVFEKVCHPVTSLFKSVVGYFLKLIVFQNGALQGRCSRWIMTPIATTVFNLIMRAEKTPVRVSAVDASRLHRAEEFLKQFGTFGTLQTPDGTTLKWALFSPQKFNEWIENNGGIRDGEWVRPKTPNDWKKLQELDQFRWFEKVDQSFRLPAPVPLTEPRCVLRCNGFGRNIAMDKPFVGLHLAAGIHYAVFDWRKEISIKGFYEDAETAYQQLLKKFSSDQIKPMGSCRGAFPVGYLKQLHHQENLDVILIHPQASLSSTIQHKDWPANVLGMWGLETIEKDGYDFDTLRHFQSLPHTTSKVCFIFSEFDRQIPRAPVKALREAAAKIGPTTEIHVPQEKNGADPHFGEPFRNPEILQRYFNFLVN